MPVTDLGQQRRERRWGKGERQVMRRRGKGRLSITVMDREQISLQIKPYRCEEVIDF